MRASRTPAPHSGTVEYRFRLFVAGMSPRSIRAITRAKAALDSFLKGNYDLEVADVYQNPHWVEEANLVALPTLVRISPTPVQRVIGDLSSPGWTGKLLAVPAARSEEA